MTEDFVGGFDRSVGLGVHVEPCHAKRASADPKATAIRMYDKVRRYWSEMLARETNRVAEIEDAVARSALQEQLDWLTKTDMAVVVSPSQNEIEAI